MGQVQCVPGGGPEAQCTTTGGHARAAPPHTSLLLPERLLPSGVKCIVTAAAPMQGLGLHREPGVDAAQVGRLQPGDIVMVHEQTADGAWLRIARRGGEDGDRPWPRRAGAVGWLLLEDGALEMLPAAPAVLLAADPTEQRYRPVDDAPAACLVVDTSPSRAVRQARGYTVQHRATTRRDAQPPLALEPAEPQPEPRPQPEPQPAPEPEPEPEPEPQPEPEPARQPRSPELPSPPVPDAEREAQFELELTADQRMLQECLPFSPRAAAAAAAAA